jgi:hypothetical protein
MFFNPPPVAGCHRAVPYTRLDELARRAMCHAEHNIRRIGPSSNHFHARAVSLLAAGAFFGPFSAGSVSRAILRGMKHTREFHAVV